MPQLRRSEWIILAYFAYTSALALTLSLRPGVRGITLGVNALAVVGVVLIAAAAEWSERPVFGVLRDWYPILMMLLGYRQMGWFAPETHTFALELRWVEWDRWLLRKAGVKEAIEGAGPWLAGLLELCYSLVYAIASFSLGVIYWRRRRERADAFLSVALLGAFGAYALFPFFPSEPPWTVFPGEDAPRYHTVFREFNAWLLGGWGIHTSVFPSAHVSVAFSCAFALRVYLREEAWAGRALMVLASFIAVATVYGRYHYAVDAVAGLGVAVMAATAGRIIQPPARVR